jgi:hypothetical protein
VILEVPGYVRLRSHAPSGLASHPFSRADKRILRKSGFVIQNPRSRQWRDLRLTPQSSLVYDPLSFASNLRAQGNLEIVFILENLGGGWKENRLIHAILAFRKHDPDPEPQLFV